MFIFLLCAPFPATAAPFHIDLVADIEEAYNDNVFFDVDDPQHDYITRVSPEFIGNWNKESTDIELTGRIDAYYYQQFDDRNTVDQIYSGQLEQEWSERFSFSMSAVYQDDEQRQWELAESRFLFNNARRRRQTYDGGGEYQINELYAVSMYYRYLAEDLDNPRAFDQRYHLIQLSTTRELDAIGEGTAGSLTLTGRSIQNRRNFGIVDPFVRRYRIWIDTSQETEDIAMRLGMMHDALKRGHFAIDMGVIYNRSTTTTHIGFGQNPLNLQDRWVTKEDDFWGYLGSMETGITHETGHVTALINYDYEPVSGNRGTTQRTTVQLWGQEWFTPQWQFNWAITGYQNRTEGIRIAGVRGAATENTEERAAEIDMGLRYYFNDYWSLGAHWQNLWARNMATDRERVRNTMSVDLRWSCPLLD